MTFVAYQRYAHIYWIPLFPLNKLVFLKCASCKHAVERKDMSMEEKAAISSQLAKARTPVWTFSAMAVIALIVAGATYAQHVTTNRTLAYQKAPKAGDIAVLFGKSDAEHPFVVLRINKIEGEAMDLSFSNYAYSTIEGARHAIDEQVAREPSSDTASAPKQDYFVAKHAAMARRTYAELDVRFVERPGE
jgi:hypothetical protein